MKATRTDVRPTFTTGRKLFLLLCGPVAGVAVVAALFSGSKSWVLDTDWSTGHPLVIIQHHVHVDR